MLESMLLSGAGCVGGIIAGAFMLDGIIAVGRDSVPRLEDTSFDIRVLTFAGGVSVLCALLFGLLPALRGSRAEASGVLRDNSRSVTADRRSNHVRHVLVGGQIALAFVLVSAASILAVSMQRLATVDLGFEPEGLLTFEVHLPEQRYDAVRRAGFHEELAARLRTLPDVVSAGSVSRLPATGTYHSWGTYALTGPRAGDDVIPSEQRVVGGDYFGTVGLEPVAGRVFDARDDAGAPNRVVISRSLAEAAFPGAEAVGQEVRMGGREATIIGVVDDVALTVQGAVAGTVYHPHTQFAENRNWPLTQVVRATSELTPLIRRAAAEIASLDPQLVLHRPAAFAEVIGRGRAQQRFTLMLMIGYAALSTLLATLGLFGVTTYLVRQRRQEMAIRVALGARPMQIRTMILRRGIQIALAGTVVGLAGAVVMGRLIASLLFQTRPADPLVLALAAGGMILVSLAAAYLPAREATRIDPNSALLRG